jgi:hypothetical protein
VLCYVILLYCYIIILLFYKDTIHWRASTVTAKAKEGNTSTLLVPERKKEETMGNVLEGVTATPLEVNTGREKVIVNSRGSSVEKLRFGG